MTAAAAKTLHEKLVEVASAVRNIEKGGTNTVQGYKFVQEADVVRAVWPEFLKRGILFYPVLRRVQSVLLYKTKAGADSFLTTIDSTWEASDGTEVKQVASMGQGTDTGGDKGMYKALTGDKKYAVLQLLGIATGDDPEIARKDEQSEDNFDRIVGPAKQEDDKATQPQHNRMFLMARQAGYDLDSAEGAKAFTDDVFKWTQKRSSKDLLKTDMKIIYEQLENAKAIQALADATEA